MHVALKLLKLAWDVGAGAAEGAIWVGHGAVEVAHVAADAWAARRALLDGKLRCPRGHVIQTVATWECAECGFVWRGEPWSCPNVECAAPDTVFLHCQICGASQRSPFRWGRP